MIEYKGQLNLGNEILGTEKTITANEVVRTADTQALAREIHHQNQLIPEQAAMLAVTMAATMTSRMRIKPRRVYEA